MSQIAVGRIYKDSQVELVLFLVSMDKSLYKTDLEVM